MRLRVVLSSPGRFHGFDLARQLTRQGMLSQVYTGYPRSKLEAVDGRLVRSFPWLIGPKMFLNQKGYQDLTARLEWFVAELFDRWVASRVQPCDVFHFFASYGLHAQREARRRYGALVVCDRGSAHILHQEEVYAEEFARWGVRRRPFDRFDHRIVERELAEYDESDVILVPSEYVVQSFLKYGIPACRLCKVPYGVDLTLFRPVPKEDDIFRVIFVGTIGLRKGIPYLLEAMARLRLPRVETWLIGPVQPVIRPFLRRYSGSLHLLGYLPRTELYRYYSQGSVFVLPSIQEGLATVLAQAMACGLPIIATDCTGAEDLFTDGVEGFIVPARDPDAISENVLYLYEHPDVRMEMGQAALRRVRAMRGWDQYGESVVACYQQRLGQRGRVAQGAGIPASVVTDDVAL